MKVQGSKSELSSVKTPDAEDLAALSNAMPSDYFSTIISTILMSPPADVGSEEQAKLSDENNESNENDIEAVNQYQNYSSLEKLIINDSGNADGQMLPHDSKAQQAVLLSPQLDKPENSDINAELDALLANQDASLSQDVMQFIRASKLDANQLTDNSPPYQALLPVSPSINQMQQVQQALSPQMKALLNQENEKISDIDDRVSIAGMRQAEYSQTMQELRTQIDAAAPVTIYTLQKGQVNVLENKRNQYVDALAQLGSFINEETSKLTTADVGMAPAPQSNTSYSAIFNSINQSDYDIKIDMMPQTLDAILKETYQASIKIYPPELGAVVAKLKLEKNKAELVIMTENNRVKEVVESNLPQLRESFKNSDINLTNISVNVENSPSGNERQDSQSSLDHRKDAFDGSDEANRPRLSSSTTKEASPQRLNALVDTYA